MPANDWIDKHRPYAESEYGIMKCDICHEEFSDPVFYQKIVSADDPRLCQRHRESVSSTDLVLILKQWGKK